MQRLGIGYVARAHGLRGELRVQLHAAGSTVLFDVERVWIGGQERVVEAARATTGAVLLTIEGVEDRDAAEALKGQPVEVERDAVSLEPGEYLLADLPGCVAVDQDGREIGRVVEVIPGAQPILVIHDAERRELLLPAVPQFVVDVDAAARRVVVSVPEDLPAEPIR
jgi:16S rRNA processing protein RimM